MTDNLPVAPAEASEPTTRQDWSPEPWEDYGCGVYSSNDILLTIFEREEDAARTIACVNALQDIPTSDLPALRERLERLTEAARGLLQAIYKLRAEGWGLLDEDTERLEAALDTKGPK